MPQASGVLHSLVVLPHDDMRVLLVNLRIYGHRAKRVVCFGLRLVQSLQLRRDCDERLVGTPNCLVPWSATHSCISSKRRVMQSPHPAIRCEFRNHFVRRAPACD